MSSSGDIGYLKYTSMGRGQPLLLLHAMGLDHSCFRPAFDRLAERFEVVYLDLPGCGRSRPWASYEALTHDSIADAIATFCEQRGFNDIVLLGHSQGGFLAQEFALRHPRLLSALVLVGTAPALDYMDVVMANAQARADETQLAAVTRVFSSPMPSDESFAELWRTILPLYFAQPAEERWAALMGDVLFSAAAWNRSAELLGSFDVRAQLAEISLPTLLVSGEDDWITPPAQGAARIAQGISSADVVVLPSCGHFPWVERSEAFFAALEPWLLTTTSATS